MLESSKNYNLIIDYKFSKNNLRTPPDSPIRKSSRDFSKHYFPEEDKCKIHLAELYTANKRIEKLTEELSEKHKSYAELEAKLDEISSLSNKKQEEMFQDNLSQKTLINELINKNKILERNSSYFELVEFYEAKIEQLKQVNIDSLNNYTESIRKLTGDISNNNRDEIWRKTLKKLENEKTCLESLISDYQKKERKMFARQKFFENYCKKAEMQFDKFSRISKDKDEQANKISFLEAEVKALSYENTSLEKSIQNLKSENLRIIEENSSLNEYLHKIKPIIKFDWEDIKRTNEENFENIIRKSKNDEYVYNSKNIILLIDNMNYFLKTLQEATPEFDLSAIFTIVEDIKKYTISLLKKIQNLTINQYHIINNCCEINYKLTELCEKNRSLAYEFQDFIDDIKNKCSKLLFDCNPK